MPHPRREFLYLSPPWEPTLRNMGLTSGTWVFDSPQVKPWRTLRERDNATLDTPQGRLHIKRHQANSTPSPASVEVNALKLLNDAKVPTLEVVAWGELSDGRSFSITQDLTGFTSGQDLLRNGETFANILEPTAHLAAQLHNAHLHHRDLYLCHFFLNKNNAKLIDISRVRPLPWLLPQRWIIKDLAQFWYSAVNEFKIPEPHLTTWLTRYGEHRKLDATTWIPKIKCKAAAIARHDARLKLTQPNRDVSLNTTRTP